MSKFTFFQPTYVKYFQCDGQNCGDNCCQRRWVINIDTDTYEKYKKIESDKKEFTSKIMYMEERKGYVVQLDENDTCPFLCEDKRCGIQKKYGEDFLSLVCKTFPRNLYQFNEIYEGSLSLTCPIVAKLALLHNEPTDFEFIEKIFPINTRLGARLRDDIKNISQLLEIQTTSIAILQERTLTINQRLAVLGLFMDGVEKTLYRDEMKFRELVDTFTSTDVLVDEMPKVLSKFKFEPKNFVRQMVCNIFESLYGHGVIFSTFDPQLLDALKEVFHLQPKSDGTISISEVTRTFVNLNEPFQKFVSKFETIFENYLVNEFFYKLYPFSIKKSITHNYFVFVTAYKILELFAFALAQKNQNFTAEDLVKLISKISNTIDHNKSYKEKISETINDNGDTYKFINLFLQV